MNPMPPILFAGILIFCGLIFGEIAVRLKLPKITGYILAGIVLDPDFTGIIPREFIANVGLVTDVALSFITFSVGGMLLFSRLRSMGKGILFITFFEAEFAFLLVAAGMVLIMPFLPQAANHAPAVFFPLAILLGALASPTDPSATLAVVHEYRAKGDVTSTIIGVSALDDVTGIVNFSLALVVAQFLVLHQHFSFASTILAPVATIAGSLALGVLFGAAFILLMRFVRREGEGFLIVAVFAMISLCYGVARMSGAEELLSTMTMGAVVVNFSPRKDAIFSLLERYTEELIFVLFFTLSGMFLNFQVLAASALLVFVFVLLRAAGKAAGTALGAFAAGSGRNVRTWTAGGLIPQGGIVIGLALLIKRNSAFDAFSDIIVSVIIGAVVVHELLGPILSKYCLSKAGELQTISRQSTVDSP
ncbi:MAG: cation:proton antiporter [Candidatus Omnitrophota bacterium]